jgi:hypothetical protein
MPRSKREVQNNYLYREVPSLRNNNSPPQFHSIHHHFFTMADPSHFADPFWEPQDQIPVALYSQPQISPFKPADLLYSISSSLETTPVGIKFAVGGLGTIAAKANSPKESVTFTIRPEKRKEQPTLKLEITKNDCVLSKKDKDADDFVAYEEKLTFKPGEDRSKSYDFVTFPKGKRSALLDTLTKKATYWISVDRSNGRIRYGQSLVNNSMTFMEIQFEKEEVKEGEKEKEKDFWMDHLVSTEVEQDGSPISSKDIKYKRHPVTVDLPPVVIPQSEMTLDILEKMTAMTFANLPQACQKLYHNISGAKITARPENFKDLPEAIDESCRDENKYCGDILKRKNTFGDKLETYLRITVGDNLVCSSSTDRFAANTNRLILLAFPTSWKSGPRITSHPFISTARPQQSSESSLARSKYHGLTKLKREVHHS